MRGLALVLVLMAAVALSGLAGARLEAMATSRPTERELLLLPNGEHLQLASLGQAPLLADLIYLWAIQYYSDYDRADRYRYVEHVFGNVIAELDPHYLDPYWLGSLILTMEARDLDAGLRLLDRGMASNPDAWILPYLAGWECYRAGDTARAADYFDRAVRVPDAPPVVLRLHASMIQRSGDEREAIGLWQEVLEDPRSDAATLAIAERRVRELEVRIEVRRLEQAVQAFRHDNARFPSRLEELLDRGYIRSVPDDPDGRSYLYDERTGRVSSTAGRLLGDAG